MKSLVFLKCIFSLQSRPIVSNDWACGQVIAGGGGFTNVHVFKPVWCIGIHLFFFFTLPLLILSSRTLVSEHFLSVYEIECSSQVKSEVVLCMGSFQDGVAEKCVEYFQRYLISGRLTPVFLYIYIRFINIGRLYGGCSIYFKKFNLSEIKLFSCFQCQIPQGNARHAKVLPFLHSGIQDHLSGKEVWSSNIGQQVTKTIHKFTFNSAFSLMLPQCCVMIIILLRLPASYPNRHSVFFVLFKSLTVNFDEFKNKRAELHFTGTITDEWCVCIQMKKGLLSEEPDKYPLLLWSYACSHNETAFFLKSIRVFQAVSIANHFMHFPPGFNSSYPFIQDEHRSGEVEGGIRVGRSAQQRAGGEREGAAGR